MCGSTTRRSANACRERCTRSSTGCATGSYYLRLNVIGGVLELTDLAYKKDAEVDSLFRVMGELKAQGVSIVYISHRLEELLRIGDHITVLRDE